MGVKRGAVNMKCKESRRAVGIDQYLRDLNAHSLLFAFLCSRCCLHMLSIQDPKCVTPMIRRVVFYFGKYKPLHF